MDRIETTRRLGGDRWDGVCSKPQVAGNSGEARMQRNEAIRSQLLGEVDTVAPAIAANALDSETLGYLAPPTIAALRETRLLRFTCPRELGGDEADPLTQIEVLEALAHVDGSAAWCVGILAATSALAGAFLPAESAKLLFAQGAPGDSGHGRPAR